MPRSRLRFPSLSHLTTVIPTATSTRCGSEPALTQNAAQNKPASATHLPYRLVLKVIGLDSAFSLSAMLVGPSVVQPTTPNPGLGSFIDGLVCWRPCSGFTAVAETGK